MKTSTQIDWREWRDDAISIAKLNELLAPHGVVIRDVSPDDCDFKDLEALSVRDHENAVAVLRIKEKANRDAARRSPQCASWSNGVAEGLKIARAALGDTGKIE